MKNTTAPTLIFICVATLVISLFHCPLFDIYFDDKEIFKYTGMAISKGNVPYADFFDHKPPLIFFFNVIRYYLGAWGYWFFDTLLAGWGAVVFCLLCLKNRMVYPFVLPLIFILLLRNPVLSFGIGMTREYTSIFLLVFFCNLFSGLNRKDFVNGILLGLIFFMQQDQIVIAAPFLLYIFAGVYKNDKREGLFFFAKYMLGFMCVAAPIIFYFAVNHALEFFWKDAFLFNFQWYNEKIPVFKQVIILNNLLSGSKTDFIFYGSVLLFLFAFFADLKNKGLIITSLCTLFLSFIAQYLTGKLSIGLSLQYYALAIAVTIPFCLFLLFTGTNFIMRTKKIHVLYYTAIMSVPLVITLLQFAANAPVQNNRGMNDQPEVQYISRLSLKDRELFIAFNGNYDFIYNEHNILSPSPWLYLNFWEWYSNWDPRSEKLRAITNDLDKYQTKYIFNFADSSKIKNRSNYIFWDNYVRLKYNPLHLSENPNAGVLWQRK